MTDAADMNPPKGFELRPIGYARSDLMARADAPRQAWEGAPEARLEILPEFAPALDGLQAGQHLWLLTWRHEAQRSALKVHPRGEVLNPKRGVFATRWPDRPNPVGLHRVKVLSVEGERRLRVQALKAIDGTPILDLKSVLEGPSAA
jgi:tRNA-Thr(GGU) m(6)t(6)A37 methyltransferase TsaA